MYLYLHYYKNESIDYQINYNTILENILGSSQNSTITYLPLYSGYENKDVLFGKIQFNNTNNIKTTYPPQYTIVENIIIELDDKTAIFTSNYYTSKSTFYEPNTKYILPIISCTGNFVGKKGYVVIEAFEDKREITISLE